MNDSLSEQIQTISSTDSSLEKIGIEFMLENSRIFEETFEFKDQ